MGTLYQGPLDKTIRDLKVTLQKSELLFPANETERRSMFLSNIDQVLNFDVQTVHFFPANREFPPEIAADKLRTALRKVLVPYDFMAGRLKFNQQSGRLEIDCNRAGVVFLVGSSEFSLDDIGDLVYPNPAFGQFIVQKPDNIGSDDQPLCIVQLTSFNCGGFVMGLSTNHCMVDGLTFKMFLQNLASQAFDDKPLAIVPYNDRSLLAARSPPKVTFPHPELLKLKIPIGEELNPPTFDCPEEELDFKIFHLTSENVNLLKEKAKIKPNNYSTATTTYKITGFNVVTAHIWRCKALSCDSKEGLERLSTVLYAVDIRPRVKPPLPASYTGNAVLTAYATAKCSELVEGPFPKLVEMVYEGAARMTDEYARSAIDWGEVYKGFPHGEFLISSWWRLGFAEVEYPWGKPRYSCPVVHHRKDIILLFPDIDAANTSAVNVLVALPVKEMEKFQSLFYKLLEAN